MIAYNESNALSGLFRDIALQDYPHDKIEVVFVDSMSTDDTKEKMEKFRDTDYGFWNVSVVQCVKRNQATSWNAALMTAKGDVIIRVDAHARIPRNFVSRNVYNIKQGENVVGGGRPNITSNVSSWKLTLLAAEDSLFGSSVASYRRPLAQKEYLDSLFHAAYRREVIAKVGGFNENLGRTEDNEFHYRIRMAGYKMCCCPDIISYQHSRKRPSRNDKAEVFKRTVDRTYTLGMSRLSFILSLCTVSFCNGTSRLFRACISRTSAFFVHSFDNLRNV